MDMILSAVNFRTFLRYTCKLKNPEVPEKTTTNGFIRTAASWTFSMEELHLVLVSMGWAKEWVSTCVVSMWMSQWCFSREVRYKDIGILNDTKIIGSLSYDKMIPGTRCHFPNTRASLDSTP
jgi:hypothetical protein